jgi:hypothetical protein
MFGWALAFGLVAPLLGRGIRWLALVMRPRVERRMVLLMPLQGLAVAGLAIAFDEATDKSASEVLFSGQEAVGPLIAGAADWSVGALVLLIACKGLAYAVCLSTSAAGRSSRPSSSAPPPASSRRSCPEWSSSPESRWAWAR